MSDADTLAALLDANERHCDHENVQRFGRTDAVGNPVIDRQCVDCGAYVDEIADRMDHSARGERP